MSEHNVTEEQLAEAFGSAHPMDWPDPPRLDQRKAGKELARFNADLKEHGLPPFTEHMTALFWGERGLGQSYAEDCGGFLLRAWSVAYGISQSVPVTTHMARATELTAEAAQDRIDKLTWQVRDTCARAEKAEALLRECETTINPPDIGGISMATWHLRLKATTAKLHDYFKASGARHDR